MAVYRQDSISMSVSHCTMLFPAVSEHSLNKGVMLAKTLEMGCPVLPAHCHAYTGLPSHAMNVNMW